MQDAVLPAAAMTAPLAAAGADADIRGVVIQIAGARLLLPNATIAEVLSYAPPAPVPGAPEWLPGRIRWRGWQVPLVAFGRLAGLSDEAGGLGTKILVLKALGGDPRLPHVAILSAGFPRLVTVSRAGLGVDGDTADLPALVQARVFLNEDEVLIPDLGALEALVAAALVEAVAPQ